MGDEVVAQVACERCGWEQVEAARWCGGCGTRLAEPATIVLDEDDPVVVRDPATADEREPVSVDDGPRAHGDAEQDVEDEAVPGRRSRRGRRAALVALVVGGMLAAGIAVAERTGAGGLHEAAAPGTSSAGGRDGARAGVASPIALARPTEVVWEHLVPSSRSPHQRTNLYLLEGHVAVEHGRGLTALDRRDGSVAWESTSGRAFVVDGLLFTHGPTHGLLDPATGEARWSVAPGAGVMAHVPGRGVVAHLPGPEGWGIALLDVETGEPRWWHPAPSPGQFSWHEVRDVSRDAILLLTGQEPEGGRGQPDVSLLLLSLEDGTLLGELPEPEDGGWGLALAAGGLLAPVGDGSMRHLDPATGEPLGGDPALEAFHLQPAGDLLLADGPRGQRVLDRGTLRELWRVPGDVHLELRFGRWAGVGVLVDHDLAKGAERLTPVDLATGEVLDGLTEFVDGYGDLAASSGAVALRQGSGVRYREASGHEWFVRLTDLGIGGAGARSTLHVQGEGLVLAQGSSAHLVAADGTGVGDVPVRPITSSAGADAREVVAAGPERFVTAHETSVVGRTRGDGVRWSTDLDAQVRAVAMAGDVAWAGTKDRLVRLDATSGEVLVARDLEQVRRLTVAGDRLLLVATSPCGTDGCATDLHALDPVTLRPLWTLDDVAKVCGAPMLAADVVSVPQFDGVLHLDARTGDPLGRWEVAERAACDGLAHVAGRWVSPGPTGLLVGAPDGNPTHVLAERTFVGPPVVAGGELLLADDEGLHAYGLDGDAVVRRWTHLLDAPPMLPPVVLPDGDLVVLQADDRLVRLRAAAA